MNKKILLFIAISLAVLSVIVIRFIYLSTWGYDLKAPFTKTESPELYLIPQPLHWSESSPVKSSITNSTCMLSAPWESPTEMEFSTTNMTFYSFSNGVHIIVMAKSTSLIGVHSLQEGGGRIIH